MTRIGRWLLAIGVVATLSTFVATQERGGQ